VKRLEGADAAACGLCHGKPIRLTWVGDAAAGSGKQGSTKAEDCPPETCAGCGRPFQRVILSWRTDAD
jgi:hypothetical protein